MDPNLTSSDRRIECFRGCNEDFVLSEVGSGDRVFYAATHLSTFVVRNFFSSNCLMS